MTSDYTGPSLTADHTAHNNTTHSEPPARGLEASSDRVDAVNARVVAAVLVVGCSKGGFKNDGGYWDDTPKLSHEDLRIHTTESFSRPAPRQFSKRNESEGRAELENRTSHRPFGVLELPNGVRNNRLSLVVLLKLVTGIIQIVGERVVEKNVVFYRLWLAHPIIKPESN
ncbi:hypothetical protein M407DRAFT_12168 [Tulasnella calospora MUT 4182]|uniref:Uncharacterized protein n=1 Tax=Tulasnella calospora MUT 4182 TaxID=1051891 RepID=A0A0C3Q3V8_9AGAM|nr:hypothetical protein M407DRAFT_12168 [Tulasnella calospora MUT 4182]